MENVIGLKELRENTEKYISQIKKGEHFTVLRRSKPVFRISAPDDGGVWETLVDFTEFAGDGISGKELLARLKKMHGQARQIS
jgi:antitoxin (DNA-binding transcriptional repressor) of toxin-antitoxin stability system